jgi:hypothetical protein
VDTSETRTHDDAGDTYEILTEIHDWDLRIHRRETTHVQNKDHYQAFWGVLIDLIVKFLGLIIKSFYNPTER